MNRHWAVAAAVAAALRVITGAGATAADAPVDPVQWTAALVSGDTPGTANVATLAVSGVIEEGWHVYALEQLPGGPTPLRVALDQNVIATAAGPATGSPAQKEYSASFGLDTHYYTHSFAVRLPVQLSAQRPAGRQLIPLSVRFQACSDRECLLPRTLHLTAVTIL